MSQDVAINALRIRIDGTTVVLDDTARGVYLALPYPVAIQVGRAMVQAAQRVESLRNANEIAADNAILLRAGAPFGLTDDPKIQQLSLKLAEDVKLPNAVEPTRVPGLPKIHMGS